MDMEMCEFCQKARDNNEPLIWDENKDGEFKWVCQDKTQAWTV